MPRKNNIQTTRRVEQSARESAGTFVVQKCPCKKKIQVNTHTTLFCHHAMLSTLSFHDAMFTPLVGTKCQHLVTPRLPLRRCRVSVLILYSLNLFCLCFRWMFLSVAYCVKKRFLPPSPAVATNLNVDASYSRNQSMNAKWTMRVRRFWRGFSHDCLFF